MQNMGGQEYMEDKILPAHLGAPGAQPWHLGGQEDLSLPTHPTPATWVHGHGWVGRLTECRPSGPHRLATPSYQMQMQRQNELFSQKH